MAQRRRFGSGRKLPSGRFQARYTHPEAGVLVSLQQTLEWRVVRFASSDRSGRHSIQQHTYSPKVTRPADVSTS
jgi:hypothetical protein